MNLTFFFLQSIQQLTAPNPATCLSSAIFLDQSPWLGKHTDCIQVCTNTHTQAHKQLQHEHGHPHTNTHLNDMVTHSARHRWLSQPLSNTHHNTERKDKTLFRVLLAVATATDGTAAEAEQVRWNSIEPPVLMRKCIFACTHVFHPDYFKVLYKSYNMAKSLARFQKNTACIKYDRHSDRGE